MRTRFVWTSASLSVLCLSCTSLLGDFSVSGEDAGPAAITAQDAGDDSTVIVVGSDASDAGEAGNVGDGQSDGPSSLPAPQPLWPMSTAFSTTRRPTFKWKLPPGEDGAHVDVCVDRACTTVAASFDAIGSQGTPQQDLPPAAVFWRVRGKSGAQMGTAYGPVWELIVPQKSASASTAWGTLLDMNGDGGDLAVGATSAPPASDGGTGPGRVYVYLGGPSGIDPNQKPIVLDGPDGGMFGYVVTSAGDVNGDGYADLLVDAYGVDNSIGRAYLYLGGPTGPTNKPSVTFLDPNPASFAGFGSSMASLGDIDGDGYGDIAIWNPGGSSSYIYRGGPNGPSATPTSSAWTSLNAIANVGDVNGDGYEDVAGTTNQSGMDEVDVYTGGPQGFSQQPSAKIVPLSSTDRLNYVVAAGDVNADGYADLVIDDAASTGVHSVLVYTGSSGGISTAAPAATLKNPSMAAVSNYGADIATAGDFSGTGYSGIVVADPDCSASGCVYVWGTGSGLGTSPVATFGAPDGGSPSNGFIVGSGDFDGDGMTDVFFSDPGDSVAPGGMVSIISWTNVPHVGTTLFAPDGPRSEFGSWVAGR